MTDTPKTSDKTLISDYADPLEGAPRAATIVSLLVISLVIGALIGLFVQVMLTLMNHCIKLVWGVAGGLDATPWLPMVLCPVGGFIIGTWNARFHAAPKPLEEVLHTVKVTGVYRVGNVPAAIVAFLFPLAFGGSIGPEAGLTGFISGAATRLSATLRRAGLKAKSLADVTVSATICAVFGAPFAGLVASVENMPGKSGSQSTAGRATDAQAVQDKPDESHFTYRRGVKAVLYGVAAVGAFLGMGLVSRLLGGGGGLPSLEDFSEMPLADGVWIIVCIAAGYALALIFGTATQASAALGARLDGHDLAKGVVAGVALGILGTLLPYVLFSGEEQLGEILEVWQNLGALMLVATACAKVAMTPLCIEMGWCGGSIFPCIFSGIALGLGVSTLTGVNAMFCATCTCAAFLGAKMHKPVFAAALLLLCFPPASLPWMIVAAAAGAAIPQPKALKTE